MASQGIGDHSFEINDEPEAVGKGSASQTRLKEYS
jgi:hypothetical protein